MSLYQELKQNGIETSHWQSDLYFPVTDESLAILRNHPLQYSNATKFTDEITKKSWFDVPFGFMPFWEKIRGATA